MIHEPAPRHACERAVDDWLKLHLTEPAIGNEPAYTLAVAYSGGADSTALLCATRARWAGKLLALHVHHGLQAAADGFERHAAQACSTLGVEMRSVHANVQVVPGESTEDAARTARYEHLARLAQEAKVDCVLLGQHADDQAETLMLALSRGAGLPGLAAMPARFERHRMRFARPLLHVPGALLRDYATASGLGFVDDPSNADLRYTRNRIRAVLTPAWQRCFPGYQQRLLRSAGHVAQAQRLLDELAAMDLREAGVPPKLAALQALSRDRQTNLLRHWLRAHAGTNASEAQMKELLDQMEDCRTRGHRIRIKVGEGEVARDGDRLVYTANL